jgi:ABC-type iron transport system FetAB permease component
MEAAEVGAHGGAAEVVPLDASHVLLSAVPVAVTAALSRRLGLRLESSLAVGVLRCFLQLNVLGYLLVPIFQA